MNRAFSFIGGKTLRHDLWIVAAAAAVFFFNLGGPRLWDDDEPRNSQCAREMLARGDWIVPTFNDELRVDKPVLLYWLMMAAYSLLGDGEFSARVWSACLGTGTLLLTDRIGRRLFSPQVGFWSAMMLAVSMMFAVSSRAATPDATLIFFTTLAMYAWVARRPGRFGHLPAYACMGLAVLAKGPVGIVLPLTVLACHAIASLEPPLAAAIARRPRNWRQSTWAFFGTLAAWLAPPRVWRAAVPLRPVSGLALAAAVALPWYVLVGVETKGAWLEGFLGRHNLARFTTAMEGHSGPFFYYVLAILAGFFPWSIFLGPTVLHVGRKFATPGPDRDAWRFVASWAVAYVAFFSIASTKLPSYVLPAYPALAIATAGFLRHWLDNPAAVHKTPIAIALASFAIVGIGVVAGLPVLAHFLLPGEAWLGILGLPLAIGGAIAFALWRRDRLEAVPRVLAVASVAFSAGLFGIGAPAVSRHANAVSLMEKIAGSLDLAPGERMPTIGAYRYSAPSLVYYAARPIRYLDDPGAAADLLASDVAARLIVPHDRIEELRPHLPADVVEISRERRFLRRKDLVLLGRRPALARRETQSSARR